MKYFGVFAWNVHQQGGYDVKRKGKIPPSERKIPHWIKGEIVGHDIVVLTEFCTKCEDRTKFIESLVKEGYCCVASENPGGNDVLIAVKSPLRIIRPPYTGCPSPYELCYDNDNLPENLRVDVDCGDGDILSVLGVRIKDLSYLTKKDKEGNIIDYTPQAKQRCKEFEKIMGLVDKIEHPVLIAGDFNNYRRDTFLKETWGVHKIDKILQSKGFTLHTPKGSSIFRERNFLTNRKTCRKEEIFFPDDHFATKGVVIEGEEYDREFTSRCTDKDKYRGTDLSNVSPPFPDHAILKGTLIFPPQKK